jgi:hypothetical protein
MLTQLSVINDCLAIMGEAPLNSLSEDHIFKAAAVNTLTRVSERIQSRGWWFNKESLALAVNPTDSRIYLPADVVSTITFSQRPNLTQRGRVVYDLEHGTDIFPTGTTLAAQVIRSLSIDLLPALMATYIAAQTVLEFQNLYDGDQTKTRNLMVAAQQALGEVTAEHIRNRSVNIINSNVTVARLKSNRR